MPIFDRGAKRFLFCIQSDFAGVQSLSVVRNSPMREHEARNEGARRMVTGSWDGQLRLLDIDMQSCIDMREARLDSSHAIVLKMKKSWK